MLVVFAHNNSPSTDGREQTVYTGEDAKEQNVICNISNFKWLIADLSYIFFEVVYLYCPGYYSR